MNCLSRRQYAKIAIYILKVDYLKIQVEFVTAHLDLLILLVGSKFIITSLKIQVGMDYK